MGVGIASAGISLGLFIGVAASFVYIILTGIKWASERLDPPQGKKEIDRCARCGGKFIDVEDGICSMCDLTICAHCSVQYQQAWLCATCIKRRDIDLIGKSWVLSKFRERISGTAPRARYGKRENDVRDFVEKLTENILGGRLDDVRIDHITEDPQYVHFMDKYEDVLSLTLSRLITAVQLIVDGVLEEKKESPRKIHEQLKSLVSDIILEASSLKLSSDWEGTGKGFGTKTYEDILATAILNKIVQNVGFGSIPFNEYIKNQDQSASRLSNDHNFIGNKHLYNQENVASKKNNDLGPEFNVDILDELLYSNNQNENERWKENWVLEKKSNECSVAMLIPSPNDQVRPLIGDLDVDQLSDLSDIEDEHFDVLGKRKISGDSLAHSSLEDLTGNVKINGVHKVNGNALKPRDIEDVSDLNIVEAKNSVFSCSDVSSDDDISKKEKDRECSEVTHQNSTKVTLCHMEPQKDIALDRVIKERISVKQLAKQFSKGENTSHAKHAVHSLTARNLTRDHISSPLNTNIEYWESIAKKK